MNYKKKSIYCTEKIKTVTTTQTTINIVQNINNNKNTATVISKPNKNTSNVKKQIPLSSYARSKVGSSIANAFDKVINVEGADDKNINVAYRYNIAGKEYESNKVQHLKKIKNGDKEEIRVKKDSPEVILKYNDINYAVLCDVLIMPEVSL